ncbi:MAG: diaminopimelate epimerase [Proteobacteria bacterium]|nr:diaminopimelate epimerase [Luminiphilus sp.]MBL6821939.1 diaminopimelate epimerase [Luminiphilus sp.]MDA0650119.1 diaminopimelate epimerase [Pseudomonadota bacterium]
MKLSFSKMQGAGNDFVIIDAVTQVVDLSTAHIKRIADRRRGVGCDQVLLLSPPDDPDADFRYSIFNADGSRAGQCGNGARCVGRFLREKKLTRQRELTLLTDGEPLSLSITEDGRVFAGLAAPKFSPESVPFSASETAAQYPLEVQGQNLSVGVLSMGNPHAILMVDDCDSAPVSSLGPLIESHERFPDRVNVGFLQVNSRNDAKLRVYERGVGETEACGSGACAAAVHGIQLGLLDPDVTLQLPGGKLTVSWEGGNSPVWLGGPTASVFDGTISLRG